MPRDYALYYTTNLSDRYVQMVVLRFAGLASAQSEFDLPQGLDKVRIQLLVTSCDSTFLDASEKSCMI
jgi:hypothetical protein